MQVYFARGGGGHASSHSSVSHSSSRSSSSHSSSSSKSTTKSTTKTTPKATAPKKTTTTKQTTTVSKTSGAKGKAATTKPAQKTLNGKPLSEGQTVTHQHFHNYSAPAGSVVYYRDNSVLDYLPWIYLFSQTNSPNNQQAVVVQPDGKQVVTKEEGGVNGLVILNWFILILIALAIIGGIVYAVNKFTEK